MEPPFHRGVAAWRQLSLASRCSTELLSGIVRRWPVRTGAFPRFELWPESQNRRGLRYTRRGSVIAFGHSTTITDKTNWMLDTVLVVGDVVELRSGQGTQEGAAHGPERAYTVHHIGEVVVHRYAERMSP